MRVSVPRELPRRRGRYLGATMNPRARTGRVLTTAGLLMAASAAYAGVIPVPNGSFESPATVFVSTLIEAWEKPPVPPDYSEGGGFTWDQLSGVFKNTPPGRFDHIGNCDGAQALFIFAVPGAGLRQPSLPAPGGTGLAQFVVGHAYRLTVGVIGGGGGMAPGSVLELGLTSRDGQGSTLRVASIAVSHDPLVFPAMTNLVDVSFTTPVVQAEDAWAGGPIGLDLIALAGTAPPGGYWDLDNVRLVDLAPPRLTIPMRVADAIEFGIVTEPGVGVEVLASDNPARPGPEWERLGRLASETGTVVFRDAVSGTGRRYYRAELVP